MRLNSFAKHGEDDARFNRDGLAAALIMVHVLEVVQLVRTQE